MENYTTINEALKTAATALGNLMLSATRANNSLVGIIYRALDAAANANKAAQEAAQKAQEEKGGSET